MKKYLLGLGVLLFFAGAVHAAGERTLRNRSYESYVDTGEVISVEITLSSATVVSTVTIPSGVKGFRIYSRSSASRFSVQNGATERAAEAVGTVDGSAAQADLDIVEADFGVGGIAKADQWETRLLPYDSRQRYLYLRSTVANVVIDLELF